MSVKLLIELNLVFLSLTGGCTGSSESTLVKMAHCWKSHVTVQIEDVDIAGVHTNHCASQVICPSVRLSIQILTREW